MASPTTLPPFFSYGYAIDKGIRESYGLDARPTRKELLERGEAWRPYRTFATWYMWGVRRLAQRNERERTRIVSL